VNELTGIILKTIFADNLALSYFLGMCTFLAVSTRVATALGTGLAIIVILTITVPLNNIIYNSLLAEGALEWVSIGEQNLGDQNLSFLKLVVFIGTIAAMVQIIELVLQRFSPALHRALGVFLPLITVNCAILGASLFMVERHYNVAQSTAYGFGGGVGWALAIALFAAIRENIDLRLVPVGLRGPGLAFIVTGIISMAFSAFAGITLS